MIKLDISNLIFCYTFFSAIIILIVWIISGYSTKRKFSVKDVSYIWKCALCAHIYVDSVHEDISTCPLCGSYNKREVVK